jgi:hypothetical protein
MSFNWRTMQIMHHHELTVHVFHRTHPFPCTYEKKRVPMCRSRCTYGLVSRSNKLWHSSNIYIVIIIQDDQKVSVHLMITIQKVTSNVRSVPRQSTDIYWHAELCSRRQCSVWHDPHPMYSVMAIFKSSIVCLKYFCVFLYCNHPVHRDFLITLYN